MRERRGGNDYDHQRLEFCYFCSGFSNMCIYLFVNNV